MITTLEDVQDYLNSIPNINTGGCGIAALAIYRWLKKQGKRPQGFSLLYRGYEADDLEYNAEQIEQARYSRMSVPTHIAVIHRRTLKDSNGENAHESCDTTLAQPVNETVLISLLNYGNRWNGWFRRARWVPEIAWTLDIDLSDVELHGDNHG